jgi:transposase
MTRDTINQVRSLLISAPAAMREALLKVKPQACIAACAELRSPPDGSASGSLEASLRLLAKRWLALTEELRELDGALDRLTQRAAPRLLSRFGVGSQTAATLLITAGDNPDRLRSEAALAALCGASPLEASSGKVTRHRLNRGGSRQTTPCGRLLWSACGANQRTRAYVERRTREGRSSKEIQRCLKRYIVREFYPLIIADFRAAATNS